ncbi:palmitoyltransferase ZDHHC4 isoform X2 [Molothrus ater]|uniref:palmitoyltransferase ZDHHC4 isoform X2 n=1 Tax=Molothrus ater TaxID=84834 RepID=UPI00174D965F|nr:palmitoyltransferase ZDHHC4 isoform X2 [Molothrus ater]
MPGSAAGLAPRAPTAAPLHCRARDGSHSRSSPLQGSGWVPQPLLSIPGLGMGPTAAPLHSWARDGSHSRSSPFLGSGWLQQPLLSIPGLGMGPTAAPLHSRARDGSHSRSSPFQGSGWVPQPLLSIAGLGMDFLTLFLLYLCSVLAVAALLCLCSGRQESFLTRSVTRASQVLSLVIPSQLQTVTQQAVHRLFHTRSCLFVVLHVALQAAVFGEYTWEVFVYCWELQFHLLPLLLPYLLLAANLGCFLLCSRANPGTVTQSNAASLAKVYAYDGVLFQRGLVCPTCTLEKPARSKHCSVCRTCVHRFDHHCVWVNNCIGAGNAGVFLLYLLSLAATAAAVAAVTAALLIQVLLLSNAMHGTYLDAQGQEQPVGIPLLVQHLFLTFPRIVFMLGFVILLTLVLGGYCSFSLYLALTNQTTNEWCKSRRFGGSPHLPSQPRDRPLVYKNIYSKGIWRNLKEIFSPPTVLERKKKT